MPTRIWYQSMAPVSGLAHYKASLTRHAATACSPGVEVFVNGVSAPAYRNHTPADLLPYPYVKHVLGEEAIAYALQAEREGFDAFLIGSFSEPFLLEIRSLLNIPVVSLAESSLLVACSLAETFALVTLGPPNVHRLRRVVRRHGMEGRVNGVHALPEQWDEARLDAAFSDPTALIAGFTQVARQAVANGADLVMPAEGVLNEVMRANGVRAIEGAAILDCVGAALLHAELLVNLKRRLGIGVGRRWSYLQPPPEILAEMLATERRFAPAALPSGFAAPEEGNP